MRLKQPHPPQALIEVDLSAISHNVRALADRSGRPVMAVVKADGYGHGLVESASAALRGGAWGLGVTTIDEARRLRAAGIDAPLLSWLHAPGADFDWAVAHGVDLGVSSTDALLAAAAAATAGRPASVHLKVDTGLARAGATAADWPSLLETAARLSVAGSIRVAGVWSHFAYADSPGHPTVRQQVQAMRQAADAARAAGLDSFDVHLANSAATLTDPEALFDLVRPGVSVYGLDPMGGDAADYGLRPAMRASARVLMVKDVPAGTGVSYGHAYTTTAATRLAVVPVGYADGIPRAASNRGPVSIHGRRFTVSGRVCMDQFVVDVGDLEVTAGDEVVLWGDAARGEPTAQQWADAADTIHYEIVSRVGGRFVRRYRDGDEPDQEEPSDG